MKKLHLSIAGFSSSACCFVAPCCVVLVLAVAFCMGLLYLFPFQRGFDQASTSTPLERFRLKVSSLWEAIHL